MRHLSLSQAWDETRAILSRDSRLYVSVALALIVLPQSVLWVTGLPIGPQATLLSEILYLIVILIGFAAQIALNRLAIGPSTTVGAAIGRGFARLPSLVAAFAVLIIALVVVLFLIALALAAAGLVVPPGAGQPPPTPIILLMIVLAALTFAVSQLFIPVVAAETPNPLRLFPRSWQLSRGNYLALLAFVVVVFVGIIIVTLAGQFVIGSVLVVALGRPYPGSLSALVLGVMLGIIQATVTVVSAVMLARIYVQLAGREEATADVFR